MYLGGYMRCRWVNEKNPLYVSYHDYEWGLPSYDDRYLYEMLILESFQAGLSWECVLNKREDFRAAFDNFDPYIVEKYDESKIQLLLANPKIIRNRLKINAAIQNAKIFLDIQRDFGSFSNYIWSFTNGQIMKNKDNIFHSTSSLSDLVSNDLKSRGMKFVGSTIIYSYLQAIGIIDDHETCCDCYHR